METLGWIQDLARDLRHAVLRTFIRMTIPRSERLLPAASV
jgi:hypothetical protein